MLHEFLASHRQEILRRARENVAKRAAPRATVQELETGLPLFLSQLEAVLRSKQSGLANEHGVVSGSAAVHGGELYRSGFTIAQVVHDYGDVCQVVTDLADELRAPISVAEFHTFNWCLDEATAEAVTEYQREREAVAAQDETQRLGVLAHELRNVVSSARLSFDLLKTGQVSIGGSTSKALERNLLRLAQLVDQSLTDVRLSSGIRSVAPVRVADLVEEIEVDATLQASGRDLTLSVAAVDPGLVILGDSQLLVSAVTNLVHNAVKFTRPHGHVVVTTSSTADAVRIHIADECGGLPDGVAEDLFRPFEQHSLDRTGLGLGLAISRRAAEAHGGSVQVEDHPGFGCTFTVEVPLRPSGEGVPSKRASA